MKRKAKKSLTLPPHENHDVTKEGVRVTDGFKLTKFGPIGHAWWMGFGTKIPASFAGSWWFADEPADRFMGTLDYDDIAGGKIRLVAERRGSSIFTRARGGDLLYGKTTESAHVTVFYPAIVNQSSSSHGIEQCDIRFSHAIVGDHIGKPDGCYFTEVSIAFPNLELWREKTGLGIRHHRGFREYSIRYRRTPELKITLEEGLTLRIARSATIPFSKGPDGQVALYEKTRFHFKSRKRQSLNFFLERLSLLRGFFSLATMGFCRPTQIFAISQTGRRGMKRSVTVFSHSPFRNDDQSEDHPPYRYLFSEADLKGQLSQHLATWLKNGTLLAQPLTLYHCAFHSTGFLQTKFLYLSQCFETLHRRLRGGHYVTPEEYAKVLPDLISAIPPTLDRSHRDSLKNRLKYGYQFSLRRRLELVLKEYPSLARKFHIDVRDTTEIADHRNFLTHYDGDDAERPEVNLWRLYMVLRLLVESMFLECAGIERPVVAAMLEEGEYYRLHLSGNPRR